MSLLMGASQPLAKRAWHRDDRSVERCRPPNVAACSQSRSSGPTCRTAASAHTVVLLVTAITSPNRAKLNLQGGLVPTRVTIKHRSMALAFSSAAAMTCLSVGLVAAPAATAQPDKNIDVRASIQANAATPATHQCEKRNGVDGAPYTNPAILGTAPGDTWHSVGPVTDATCVYQTSDGVSYTGTKAELSRSTAAARAS